MRIKSLVCQGTFFFIISGVGWILDFGLYSFLSIHYGVDVAYANMLAAFPAVTFVFIMSTRHIFVQQKDGWSIKKKYIVYLVYQFCLIFSISFWAQSIFIGLKTFSTINLFFDNDLLKIFVKCLITPITMVMNFIVIKFLSEKI